MPHRHSIDIVAAMTVPIVPLPVDVRLLQSIREDQELQAALQLPTTQHNMALEQESLLHVAIPHQCNTRSLTATPWLHHCRLHQATNNRDHCFPRVRGVPLAVPNLTQCCPAPRQDRRRVSSGAVHRVPLSRATRMCEGMKDNPCLTRLPRSMGAARFTSPTSLLKPLYRRPAKSFPLYNSAPRTEWCH
jgi:hypothetical protein